MGLMGDGGGCLCSVGVVVGDARDGACSRSGLPAQGLEQQPDQYHRQRGLFRTDGASNSVRRGSMGWDLCSLLFGVCIDLNVDFQR